MDPRQRLELPTIFPASGKSDRAGIPSWSSLLSQWDSPYEPPKVRAPAGGWVRHTKLAEVRVEGKRLGRHIVHDQRSHAFAAEGAAKIVSVTHPSIGLSLDQGPTSSCTANALVGALNRGPNVPANGPWTEKGAIRLYERETADEGQP